MCHEPDEPIEVAGQEETGQSPFRPTRTPGGLGSSRGIDWQTVTVTMALTPFLQALASSFGAKLAGAIDNATRSALRSFVRGQGEAARPATRRRRAAPVTLNLEGHGIRVTISEDTPAEAMAQLPAIDFTALEGLGEQPPNVEWYRRAWCATADSGESPLISAWDPSAGRWSHQTRSDAS